MHPLNRILKAICANPLFSCKILKRNGILGFCSGASMSGSRPYSAFKTAFLTIILCFSVAQVALAAAVTIAPSPCDPQYYESLKSRAWLEAQREITQNQNLIFKPDSVMEYTCFDKFMNILAYEAQNMFSETTRWGTILNSNSMDNALQNLVGTALNSYISANFNGRFLNTRSSYDYTPSNISGASGASYTCTNMRDVWKESKCMDFAADQNTDGFYTFENYQANEKRTRPTPCNNAGIGTRWQNEINNATVNANTPWTEDNVVTFFNLLDPANCNNSTLKIETGIIVQRSKLQPTAYHEKACIAPGCHYVPTGTFSTGGAIPNTGSCQN